jgi:hypothetical protein
MMLFNQYDEAKNIAVLLKREGYIEQARQITDAMIEGGTGTEIFMILRRRLSTIIDIKDLSPIVRERINVLYLKLNDALQ